MNGLNNIEMTARNECERLLHFVFIRINQSQFVCTKNETQLKFESKNKVMLIRKFLYVSSIKLTTTTTTKEKHFKLTAHQFLICKIIMIVFI